MRMFGGIACAEEALAREIRKQLDCDDCICAACYEAHRILARTVLKNASRFDKNYLKRVKKDVGAFDNYWNKLKARNRESKARRR